MVLGPVLVGVRGVLGVLVAPPSWVLGVARVVGVVRVMVGVARVAVGVARGVLVRGMVLVVGVVVPVRMPPGVEVFLSGRMVLVAPGRCCLGVVVGVVVGRVREVGVVGGRDVGVVAGRVVLLVLLALPALVAVALGPVLGGLSAADVGRLPAGGLRAAVGFRFEATLPRLLDLLITELLLLLRFMPVREPDRDVFLPLPSNSVLGDETREAEDPDRFFKPKA